MTAMLKFGLIAGYVCSGLGTADKNRRDYGIEGKFWTGWRDWRTQQGTLVKVLSLGVVIVYCLFNLFCFVSGSDYSIYHVKIACVQTSPISFASGNSGDVDVSARRLHSRNCSSNPFNGPGSPYLVVNWMPLKTRNEFFFLNSNWKFQNELMLGKWI